MQLLEGWQRGVTKHKKKPEFIDIQLPKSPNFYSKAVNYVRSRSRAKEMVELAHQRPLSHIGIEFLYSNPLKTNGKGFNPPDIKPLILSLAMAELGEDDKGIVYRFVVDLRKPKIIPLIGELFTLPVCFVGHKIKQDLFCLWNFKLEPPRHIWDTFICEEALDLGLYHVKYAVNNKMDLPSVHPRKVTV